MNEEKVEEKVEEKILTAIYPVEKIEQYIADIMVLKTQLNQLNAFSQELVKDATDETINRLGIKRPEEPKE